MTSLKGGDSAMFKWEIKNPKDFLFKSRPYPQRSPIFSLDHDLSAEFYMLLYPTTEVHVVMAPSSRKDPLNLMVKVWAEHTNPSYHGEDPIVAKHQFIPNGFCKFDGFRNNAILLEQQDYGLGVFVCCELITIEQAAESA